MEKKITNQQILEIIRRCAKKLKRTPGFRDLKAVGIDRGMIKRRWKGLSNALTEAGIPAAGTGFRYTNSTLLLDWAGVARKLGRIPTVVEYVNGGRFCHAPFGQRFRWSRVPDAFWQFAHEEGVAQEWGDVLAMVAARPRLGSRLQISTARPSPKARRDRPTYGRPLWMQELLHEPVNEGGVMFAFGALAKRLGFAVRQIRREFPDCEAVREVARGQWQPVWIEFEFESRNFLLHGHDPKKCDVIVCWVHNWAECPKKIEVVELSKVVREMWGCEEFLAK
jgi:Homing endonuclease associated repeat